MEVSGLKKRSEIDEKYRWDLSELFADQAAFESSFKTSEKMIGQLAALKGTLGKYTDDLLK